MPVVASLGVAMLGWLASPVITDVVNKSIAYLGSDITNGLEDLETTLLPQLQLTIKAAQNSAHADRLNLWLARLKNAYCDAEAILHDLEYEHLRLQVEGAEKKKRTLAKLTSKVREKVSEKVSMLSPQKRKLWQCLNKLKEVAAEAKTFRDLLGIQTGDGNDTSAGGSHSVTTGTLPVNTYFVRDGDRDQIINFLLEEQKAGSSVVAITGGGGDGKTTLAQRVYNHERVTGHFGVRRMWLSLSHQINMDIKELTKQMIECLSGKECPDLRNETLLLDELRKKLSDSKPILLVLDDVWYDDKESKADQWNTLLAPFHSLGGRFKIVFTSRFRNFPIALSPGKHIQLRDLADNDFLDLFRYYSLHGLESINTQLKNHLSYIGDQIAQKMSKSPLAAKVVGNELCKQPTIKFWQDTLDGVNLSDTMDVLLWSYERLDAPLQRCFLFCAVFTKGDRFTKSNLVQYWVALDFIQPSDGSIRSVEDICLKYFKKMEDNSIFQLVDGWYTMHDLYHDLAEKLSAGDCFRVTDSEKAIPESTVLHVFLRVDNENLKEKLCSISKLLNLRSLTLGNPLIGDEEMGEIISLISTMFKNLRILEIWSREYKALPKAIGDLRNLRYLDIYRSSLKTLPHSVSQLYHLKFLLLPESINTLPGKFCNLIKLRSIEKYDRKFNHVRTLPPIPNLGKLTSLQQLPEFCVRNEKGYKLGQLGSLREIGGCLRIVDVENVRDKDEAIEAKLKDKPKLERLELVWGKSDESSSQVDVIEALRPPKNLRFITINGYRGSSYPTWLQEHSYLQNITHVSFHNCIALSSLPPKFHEFRHCSKLILENLGALTELSSFPENLAGLRINKCPCLILVSDNELPMDVNQGGIMERVFLRLTFIGELQKKLFDHEVKSFEQTGSLENCPEQLRIIQNAHLQVDDAHELLSNVNPLGFIPTHLKKEVNRAWWSCHQQRMNFIFSGRSRANKLKLPLGLCILEMRYCCISDGALSDCLRGLAALKELHLEGIMTITTLPPAQVLESLKSLQVLKIEDCWCLRSLGGLHALPQLQEFQVDGCFLLETTGARLPSSLQSFIIRQCELHGNILSGNLPYLQTVIVAGCLVSFPPSFGQLTSLKALVLCNCNIVSGNLPRLQNVSAAGSPFSSSLSFGQLTALKSLFLFYYRNLFFNRGLEARPFIDSLAILQLPDLAVESVVQCWRGCRHLEISSSVMLNKLLSSQVFLPPQILRISHSQEEAITFEKSGHLRSIKTVGFKECKTKNLPTCLSDFSALENIIFTDCPEISELPGLPDSVQYIEISGCPLLEERCHPSGPDWHKIQHILNRWIQ